MEGEWEVLDNSSSGSGSGSGSEESVEDSTQGLIRLDHFSVETSNVVNDEPSEDGSASPGWIEPRSDAPYGPKQFSELWSDSSSDRVEDDLGLEYSTSSDEQPCTAVESRAEEKGLVWWKLPVELFKYCVFKVNPVWSFSMAAALLGFVMLGRRLYNIKKKSPTLHLPLPHKKVANQSARLNEAISIVKRVPIIRPALPSSVPMNQWSMMRV